MGMPSQSHLDRVWPPGAREENLPIQVHLLFFSLPEVFPRPVLDIRTFTLVV